MRTKITKLEKPFTDKYKNNYLVTFDYLGELKNAIITFNMLTYNKKLTINVDDEIEVVKGFRGGQVQFRVLKIY